MSSQMDQADYRYWSQIAGAMSIDEVRLTERLHSLDAPHWRWLERATWLGMLAGAAGLSIGVATVGPRPVVCAMIGPEDLKTWGPAIGAFISGVCLGLNALAATLHRFQKAKKSPRRRRKKPPAGKQTDAQQAP
jgi:hypothetical protein